MPLTWLTLNCKYITSDSQKCSYMYVQHTTNRRFKMLVSFCFSLPNTLQTEINIIFTAWVTMRQFSKCRVINWLATC